MNSSPNSFVAASRWTWVDNARAIGIVAVVLGHTTALPDSVVKFVFSFHMPLFFFLAGAVLKPDARTTSFGDLLRRTTQRLLVPYFVFWCASTIYWMATRQFGSSVERFRDVSLLAPLRGLLIGTGAELFVNVALWFFPCLFVTTLLFHSLRGLRTIRGAVAVLVLCGILGHASPVTLGMRLPWNLEVALIAVGFYGCGHLCCQRSSNFSPAPSSRSLVAFVAVLSLIATVTISQANDGVSLNDMRFGQIGLFYLGAASGIVGVVALSAILPTTRVARWLSENSVVIFPTHLILFSLFTGIGVVVFGAPMEFKEQSVLWSVAYTAAALLVCVPLAWSLRQFAPWAIGQRLRTATEPRPVVGVFWKWAKVER